MVPFLRFLRRFGRRSARYFTHFEKSVAEKNWIAIRRVSVCSLALLTGYFVMALFVFRQTILLATYGAFILLHIGLVAYTRRKKGVPSARQAEAVCLAYIVLIMAFITIISVFPYPGRPAIFFSLFCLLMNVMFILPFWHITGLLTAIEVVFLLLVRLFKEPATFGYDMFSSVTAWLLGMILVYMLLDLHFREGKALARLEAASSVDVTTTLPNRRAFNEQLVSQFAQCADRGQPLALLMLDIDGFKAFNDRYGHVAGDDCLYQVGTALRAYAEETGIFIARYGGEELVTIISGSKAGQYLKIAENTRRLVADCAVPLEREEAHVTASVGAAIVTPRRGDSYLELIKMADAALYRAKAAGKNRVVPYST